MSRWWRPRQGGARTLSRLWRRSLAAGNVNVYTVFTSVAFIRCSVPELSQVNILAKYRTVSRQIGKWGDCKIHAPDMA
jgi:hypothetical protein